MDAPRHRQSQGSQAYPADNPYGAYNPPAAADKGFSQNGYYAANGGGYRPRSPAVFYSGDEGTLSAFLSTLIRSARTAFAGIGSGAGGSQSLGGSLSSLLPKAPSNSTSTPSSHRRSLSVPVTSLIPSSSTLGFVFLCCLWYLSSAFSSNTGKSILTRFRYPVTLTFIQFAFVAGYCVVVLSLREQFGSRVAGHHHPHHGAGLSKRRGSLATLGAWGIRRPSRHMFHGTFMMSLFQIAGHVFSSMAIARVPVSTVHTIKALSPLFTVLSYAALFGVRYTSATYVALLPLTIGVMLACSFDLRANAVGFLCALGSTFIFVAQNIFSKKLLPKENAVVSAEEKSQGVGAASGGGSGGGVGGHAKLDKLNLLFYSSGMAFILMIPIWLYSDASALFLGPATVTTNIQQPATSMSELVFFFFANGTVHFAQNLLAFSLLARTSPVTYSIASLVKRIAVICIAIVWSGQHVSFIQAVGMTSTFVGLWMYNSAKTDVDKGEKRRTQVEKRMELSLPQTVGDARDLDGGFTPPPSNLHAQAYGNPLSPTQKAPSYSVVMGASLPGNPRSPTLANGFTSGSQPHPAPAPPPPHSHAYETQHPPQCSLSSSQHHAPSAPSYASPPLHQNGFAPAAPSSTNYLFASTNSTGPTINGAAGPRNRQASSSVSRDSSPAAMKTGGRHHPVLGGIQPVPTSLFGGGGGGGTATASGAGQLC